MLKHMPRVALFILLAGALADAAHATVTPLEAENATLNGLTLRAHAAASGGYRVVQFDAVGDFISYDTVPDGSYLYITYSLGLATPKKCSVYVNGTDATTATFYPTGDWNVYKPLLLTLPVSGSVRFQLDADDQTFNLDESCASQDKIEIMDELTSALAGLESLRQRYRADLMGTSGNNAQTYMNSLKADGSWASINYTTNVVQYAHLDRCEEMARGYNKAGHALQGSPLLLDAVRRSFHYWMVGDFQDWNWWHNEIGVPKAIADIMLIAEDEIAPADWWKALQIVHRAWPPPNNSMGRGQNLIYRVPQTIQRGVMEDDPAVTYEAIEATAGEIRVPADEGIQVDWAFHQHGPQLYWGGYGQGFSSDISAIAVKIVGTAFTLAPEKLDILAGLILDGQQWAIRGHALDPGVTGRGISRKGASTGGNAFASVCDRMAALGNARSGEFQNMAKNIRGQSGAVALSGNRHFWTSDFMAHHRTGYYTSFKMASSRVYGTESGNGEGLKNYHLPDGAAWLYRRGDEYDDIYPVLEWRRIPGITCEQYTESIPLCQWGANSWSNTTWAGGASDGTYGVAAFHLVRLDVDARKAAFYFDDEFVLLGAAISCDGTQPVYTSINQCLLKTEVTVHDGASASAVSTGQHNYANPKWIHHDAVGYVPLAGASITVKRDTQTGNWYDINHGYDTTAVNKDVFSAWVDHGAKPSAGSCAYAVVPGVDTAATDAWASAPPVTVLANTASLQAVRHNTLGVAGVVFAAAGAISLDSGLTVAVDQPCLVLARWSGDGFGAAVSNPENEALTVHLTVTRELAGLGVEWSETEQVSRLTFDLPGGEYAGQSVVRSYGTSHFNLVQRVALETDGHLWGGTYNLTTTQWGDTADAYSSATVDFSFMPDQWIAVYLYDYGTAGYAEGMYLYRQTSW